MNGILLQIMYFSFIDLRFTLIMESSVLQLLKYILTPNVNVHGVRSFKSKVESLYRQDSVLIIERDTQDLSLFGHRIAMGKHRKQRKEKPHKLMAVTTYFVMQLSKLEDLWHILLQAQFLIVTLLPWLIPFLGSIDSVKRVLKSIQ